VGGEVVSNVIFFLSFSFFFVCCVLNLQVACNRPCAVRWGASDSRFVFLKKAVSVLLLKTHLVNEVALGVLQRTLTLDNDLFREDAAPVLSVLCEKCMRYDSFDRPTFPEITQMLK
jgi:hypothetical protein